MTDPAKDLRARIDADREAWRALVAEVGFDRMDEPGPMGEWTFKDLAAHLLGWREWTLTRLEAAATGRPVSDPPWPADLDDDAVNDWIQAQSETRSTQDVLDAIDATYEQLATALTALPATTLTDPDALPWLDGTAAVDVDWVSHLNQEHLPSIRDWLARRA